MKKLVVLLLAAMMTLSLVACGGNNNNAGTNTENNQNTEADKNTEDQNTEDQNASTESKVPAFTWDWDKLVFTFNEDGTCKMELPDYKIAEECTWKQNEDGTYTITSPSGKEYTSYTGDDGLVHLDYVADASEQLVAQLYIK